MYLKIPVDSPDENQCWVSFSSSDSNIIHVFLLFPVATNFEF